MKSNKNVLIISYWFPPNPGVGGRRWAKFAKYLIRENYNVHVISAKNVFNEISAWSDDIADLDINNEQLSLRYPVSLLSAPVTIIDKIKYRFGLIVAKLFSRGNYYDNTIFWKRQLINKAKEVIEQNNIQNIIVSAAPFHLLYYGINIKKLYPEINMVADFRDVWTDGAHFGMSIISKKRIKQEEKYEKDVLNNYDVIISPLESYLNTLKNKVTENQRNKFIHILHSYDEDDIKVLKKANNESGIKITYAGTIYFGLDEYFKKMCKCLKDIKMNNEILYQKISFQMYSNEIIYQNYFSDYKIDIVTYKKPVSSSKIFKVLYESDYIIILLNEEFKNYFSSKFYEILALKKPILYIGPMGDVSDFIKENKCGICLDLDNFEETFLSVLTNKNNFYKPLVDIEKFSFEQTTKNLINILK